ncbi:hypothetical protein NEIG_00658 [Nematocida sp. ERTm5]|nr:hypothetical protein NEIG_00658 [Nematocida sp. ERTm5]
MSNTPIWLLNGTSKEVILKSVLKDINAMAHYNDIQNIIQSAVFATRVNYLTKVSIIVFLFLRSKSIPILIEDVLIYCNLNRIAFLSLLVKNKGIVSNSTVTMEYVLNVLDRIYSLFEPEITLTYDYIKEKVLVLFNSTYYHNKSPLTSILILSFYNDKKKLTEIVKEHYISITMYSVNKEITRISQIIKEKIKEKREVLSENVDNRKAEMCEDLENQELIDPDEDGCTDGVLTAYGILKQQQERENKIDRAISLYRSGLGTNNKYATDYEGLLIEGMVRKGYSKEMIMSLTHKGLEYYCRYK